MKHLRIPAGGSFVILCFLASTAAAVERALTYEGYLTDSSSVPIDATNVGFQFDIYGQPSGGTSCLLYSERQTAMPSGGHFAVKVGTGTATNFGGRTSLDQVVSARTALAGSSCTYDPTPAGNSLFLRVSVFDGSSYVAISDVGLTPAPRAMDADYVAGFPSSSLLRVADASGPQSASVLSPANFTELLALLNGTSTHYVLSGSSIDGSLVSSGTIGGSTSINTTGSIAAGNISGNSGAFKSVEVWKSDNSRKVTVTAPASLATNYGLVLPATAGSANQFLQTDGSGNLSWATPNSGITSVAGIPPVVATGGSSVTISVNSATTSSPGVVQLAVDGGATAGQVVQANDSRLSNSRAPSGAAGGDLSGTYPNPTISSGAVTTAKLFSNPGINRLVATDGTTGATLAPLSCSAGQLLAWNATNGWVCSNLSAADLPGGGYDATYFKNGGNSYGAAAALGTNDNFPVRIQANHLTAMTILPSGNVGIGTNNPGYALEVNGFARATQICIGSDCRSVWPGAGGTVTSVTSANSDISVATNTSTPFLTLNSGTGANQIVKLDAAAKLPAVDGSALTSLNASNIASGTLPMGRLPAFVGDVTSTLGTNTLTLNTVPLNKGGTGLTSTGVANQLLGMNGAASGLEYKTLAAGSGITIVPSAGALTINAAGGAGTVTNVAGIAPIAVASGTTTPQISMTQAGPSQNGYLSSGDYNTFNSKLSTAIADVTYFRSGGNAFGGVAVLGTTDPNPVSIITGSAARMRIDTSGNVGVNTTSPIAKLDVRADSSGSPGLFVGGSTSAGMATASMNTGVTNGIGLMIQSTAGMYAHGIDITMQAANQTAAVLGATGSGSYALIVPPSSGTVGIGTTAPGFALTVAGATTAPPVSIQNTTTAGISAINFVDNLGTSQGGFGYGNTSSTYAGTMFLTGGSTAPISIWAGGAERIHIVPATGYVGIGTSNPGYALEVAGLTANNSGAWAVRSDRRLKRDIATIENPLDTILRLRGVSFRWKDEQKNQEMGLQRGFIAQEVQEVIPEWVREGNDGFLRLEKVGIEAYLVEAIKEVYHKWSDSHSEIEKLKRKNLELETKIRKSESENAAIKAYLCAKDPGSPLCK